MSARSTELPTEVWSRVFSEAAAAGVLQTDLTGGEPLARPDIVDLVRAARTSSLYVSLITSGMPLDESRLAKLIEAGLDHVQLSFQGAEEETAAEISGTKTHAQKLRVLQWLAKVRVGVTLNFVIHRRNIHQLDAMLKIAESSSATRVEFANVQYYGWGFTNRGNLLPTRQQLDHSLVALKSAQERLRGKIRIEYVVPDYYAKYPKPCVGGWGRKLMLITPSGDALPCHAAQVIPGMRFDNVKERSVREIWENSEAFLKFRGQHWMQEPCKTCDRREIDFGGCRCQAMLIVGDPAATDPVCTLSPNRAKVDAILAALPTELPVAESGNDAANLSQLNPARPNPPLINPAWIYRTNPS
jgi:pyrroloquinoline quinone biosynthesis protein E